LLPPCTCWTRR